MRQRTLIASSLLLSLCLSLSIPGAGANEPDIGKLSKSASTNRISTDTAGGAWDWNNWQDVVADCKVYVFRKRMISKK